MRGFYLPLPVHNLSDMKKMVNAMTEGDHLILHTDWGVIRICPRSEGIQRLEVDAQGQLAGIHEHYLPSGVSLLPLQWGDGRWEVLLPVRVEIVEPLDDTSLGRLATSTE